MTLTNRSLKSACIALAADHPEFEHVYSIYGVPPLWNREPGFATLLHIILEQQVSLSSGKACFDKLTAQIGEIKPESILALSDAELKTIGFSRQKTSYARHLSGAVLERRIDLDNLHNLPDDEAKAHLTELKGVGNWTSDIYMLMVLLRPDVMPRGDIALHQAWREIAGLDARPQADEFIMLAERWSPHRSTAARLLWHYYLSKRNKTSGDSANI
jgi:DNA-3-methyladenine glycosylase II